MSLIIEFPVISVVDGSCLGHLLALFSTPSSTYNFDTDVFEDDYLNLIKVSAVFH
jgi:hypothetical protein